MESAELDSLQLFLGEVARHKLLTAAEEVALAKRIEAGDDSAKRRMVESNLRLVIAIAKEYRGSGAPLLDLIQEGCLGLSRGAEKFDWRLGFRFSTYATLGLRGVSGSGASDTYVGHGCDRESRRAGRHRLAS